METLNKIKFFLSLVAVLLFSCKSMTTNIHLQDEKRKWKIELVENKITGRKYKNNDTVEKWLKENPNNCFAISDDLIGYENDFNGDGENDVLLAMNLSPSVGGNLQRSTLLKLIYKKGDDILTNSVLTQTIEKRISSEHLKDKTGYFLSGPGNVLFHITSCGKTINGEYELWWIKDEHYRPSYRGIFKYDIKQNTMEITYEKTK